MTQPIANRKRFLYVVAGDIASLWLSQRVYLHARLLQCCLFASNCNARIACYMILLVLKAGWFQQAPTNVITPSQGEDVGLLLSQWEGVWHMRAQHGQKKTGVSQGD